MSCNWCIIGFNEELVASVAALVTYATSDVDQFCRAST